MNKNFRYVNLPADLVDEIQTRAIKRASRDGLPVSTAAMVRRYILMGMESEKRGGINSQFQPGWPTCLK